MVSDGALRHGSRFGARSNVSHVFRGEFGSGMPLPSAVFTSVYCSLKSVIFSEPSPILPTRDAVDSLRGDTVAICHSRGWLTARQCPANCFNGLSLKFGVMRFFAARRAALRNHVICIDLMIAKKQMRRVAARRIIASMQDGKAVRYLSVGNNPRRTMRLYRAAICKTHVTVPFFISVPGELNASAGGTFKPWKQAALKRAVRQSPGWRLVHDVAAGHARLGLKSCHQANLMSGLANTRGGL